MPPPPLLEIAAANRDLIDLQKDFVPAPPFTFQGIFFELVIERALLLYLFHDLSKLINTPRHRGVIIYLFINISSPQHLTPTIQPPMAELVGTVFGVVGAVGVLGQIFDGCIKAYSFFTSASNLGRDSERLVCKIRIEEMRLLVWGREWGVIEGRLEEYLVKESQMGNERLRGLALDILVELHRSISDFGRLKERYGLREEGGDGSQRALAGKKDGGTGVAGRLRNELQLRAKWVIADKEKVCVFYFLFCISRDQNYIFSSLLRSTSQYSQHICTKTILIF